MIVYYVLIRLHMVVRLLLQSFKSPLPIPTFFPFLSYQLAFPPYLRNSETISFLIGELTVLAYAMSNGVNPYFLLFSLTIVLMSFPL